MHFSPAITNWLTDVRTAYGANTRNPSVPTSWPLFVSPSNAGAAINKIPSALNVFVGCCGAAAKNDKGQPSLFLPYPNFPKILFPVQNNPPPPGCRVQNDPPQWQPILKLISNWTTCMNNASPDAHCAAMQDVRKMFAANYKNYQEN